MQSESKRRITISVPEDVAASVEATVEAGRAKSVSAYFAAAAADHVARERAVERLDEALGGPPPAEAIAWAERALGVTAAQERTAS